MFCQKNSKGLCQVQTMETSEKILRNASTYEEMSCRLAGVSDLIAAEGKYHLKCYARFPRNSGKVARSNQVQDSDSDPRGTCFEETMSLLENGMSRGNIYSLKAVWTYYSRRLELHYHLDPGVYRGNKFKEEDPTFSTQQSFICSANEPFGIPLDSFNESKRICPAFFC